jgi:hypothetical protein
VHTANDNSNNHHHYYRSTNNHHHYYRSTNNFYHHYRSTNNINYDDCALHCTAIDDNDSVTVHSTTSHHSTTSTTNHHNAILQLPICNYYHNGWLLYKDINNSYLGITMHVSWSIEMRRMTEFIVKIKKNAD